MHIHAPTTTTTTTAGPYGWDRGLNKTGAYRLSQHLLARILLAVPTVAAHTHQDQSASPVLFDMTWGSRSSDNRVEMYTGCIGTAPGESVYAYARQTLHCCPTLSAMYAASVITAEALQRVKCSRITMAENVSCNSCAVLHSWRYCISRQHRSDRTIQMRPLLRYKTNPDEIR